MFTGFFFIAFVCLLVSYAMTHEKKSRAWEINFWVSAVASVLFLVGYALTT